METVAYARVIVGLALVVAAILLSAWLARRFGLAGSAGPRRADLQLKSSLALGPRHRLAIVQVEAERFVIGIGPQGITLLHTLPPASHDLLDAVEATSVHDSALASKAASPSKAFQTVLAQWLQGHKSS